MRKFVGADVEVVIVAGLVDADAPEDDGGVVPVAANHAAYVVDGDELPGLFADVLPAGDLFEDEEPDLVAAVEEVTGLRVMRGTDDVAVEILSEDVGVFALRTCGHGLTDERKGLMAIKAAQFDDITVEREALRSELSFAEADAAGVGVDGATVLEEGYVDDVEMRLVEVPELGVFSGMRG